MSQVAIWRRNTNKVNNFLSKHALLFNPRFKEPRLLSRFIANYVGFEYSQSHPTEEIRCKFFWPDNTGMGFFYDLSESLNYYEWTPSPLLEFHHIFMLFILDKSLDFGVVDKYISREFNKKKINSIKKKWLNKDQDIERRRVLVNALDNYIRQDYHSTATTLVLLWENIIYEKANAIGMRRTSQNTRANFALLCENNEENGNVFIGNERPLIEQYLSEIVFQNCNSPADIRPDLPLRHAAAHGFDTGNSKKRALNAILFTDILVEMEPLP